MKGDPCAAYLLNERLKGLHEPCSHCEGTGVVFVQELDFPFFIKMNLVTYSWVERPCVFCRGEKEVKDEDAGEDSGDSDDDSGVAVSDPSVRSSDRSDPE